MRYIFLVLITISLSGNNLLDSYRVNGMAKLEKQMDMQLTKKEYWSNFLKDKDTTFGYIESYKHILTCNKEKSTLSLYSLEDKTFELTKEYSAFTGRRKGDKTKEGDLKTPIGIYTIVKKLSKDTKLNEFYGPLAFVTSYPNTYDTYMGKSGSGIWIHGLPTKEDRDDYTRGCIAINNSNIECLNKNIDITNTILIINSKEVKKDISKKVLTNILSELYKWRFTWLYSDIDAYLNFYSKKFIRNDGMNINTFQIYKTRVFKKTERKSIVFKNINIIPYPNSTNKYQVTFKEIYKSDTFEFIGDKVLIITLNDDGFMNIITEK